MTPEESRGVAKANEVSLISCKEPNSLHNSLSREFLVANGTLLSTLLSSVL